MRRSGRADRNQESALDRLAEVDHPLGFLEPETNCRYPDPALQVALDLSQVSYIATANSLDPLPSPLRDRFRVITFPKPSAKHLDGLLPAVIADLVGDNVGDCAGRGADLFESSSAEFIGAMILGVALYKASGASSDSIAWIFYPLLIGAASLVLTAD